MNKSADAGHCKLSCETINFIMSDLSLESVCFHKRYGTRF